MEEEHGIITNKRQWRITITEGALPGLHHVGLSWRTFPCKATDWDGHQYSQFVVSGQRIASPEDLRAVLTAAIEGEWWEDQRRSYRPPPRRSDSPSE